MDAFKLILVSLAGWMNRQQQHVIEYLQEEIRVLKEQQGDGRPKFTGEQRRRLAGNAKLLNFGRMKEIANVLNLTESRICQIHGKVITRLKEALEARARMLRPLAFEAVWQQHHQAT